MHCEKGASVRLPGDSALEREAEAGHGQGDGQHRDHVEAGEGKRADVLGETVALVATTGDGGGLNDTVGPLPFTGFDVIAMLAVALAETGLGLALQRAVSKQPRELD